MQKNRIKYNKEIISIIVIGVLLIVLSIYIYRTEYRREYAERNDILFSRVNRSEFKLSELIRYNEKFVEVGEESIHGYGQFIVPHDGDKNHPLALELFNVSCFPSSGLCGMNSTSMSRSDWSRDSDQYGDDRYGINHFENEYIIISDTVNKIGDIASGEIVAEMEFVQDCGKQVLRIDVGKQEVSKTWICDGEILDTQFAE